MSDDHVHLTLAEGHEDDTRWAYGTGFEDPLHGVDGVVPYGIDTGELAAVCVALADDALVLAQRLAEWTTRAPSWRRRWPWRTSDSTSWVRPACSNPAPARSTAPTATRTPTPASATQGHFRNVRLAELPGGDFAFCVACLLVLSAWRLAHFERLTASDDPVLAAITAKGVKELRYHRQYAAEWVVRLDDGTAESHHRMRPAPAQVAPYLGELFTACDVQDEAGAVLKQVTKAAGLPVPVYRPLPGTGPPRRAHRASRPAARRVAERGPSPPGADMVSVLTDVRRARRAAGRRGR